MAFPRIASFKSYAEFRSHLDRFDIPLPCDETLTGRDSVLGQPINGDGYRIGNRFCILPMEGWDGTIDGKPTELTTRRWKNFGISGAKLIWGGEAVAVRQDGRANPNQLLINDANLSSLADLRGVLLAAHLSEFDRDEDLLVGLQLTHSGRFARPNEKTHPEPRTVQRNRALDARHGICDDSKILSDGELDQLVDDFVLAANLASKAGFAFVDIKHCHGYLGHELLSGVDRDGRYGGSFENRTHFLRNIVAGIRAESPQLKIGVRVSAFDFVPYLPANASGDGDDRVGVPEPGADPRLLFGGDASGQAFDLREPSMFMSLLEELGIKLVCTTAGSPYYNPHIQRPAYFPPSDGYQPPEDPLVGVARQIRATAQLKKDHPSLIFVGSGYTYLQEWLPHVGQAVVRSGMVDSLGLGRMVLSYPELPADVMSGNKMPRKKICRTFSDCTTAPRNGMVSGCYPLDPFYKQRPEREAIKNL